MLKEVKYTGKGLEDVKSICISNPQGRDIIKPVLKVIVYLREYFGKNVEIKYETHRGIDNELINIIGEFMKSKALIL